MKSLDKLVLERVNDNNARSSWLRNNFLSILCLFGEIKLSVFIVCSSVCIALNGEKGYKKSGVLC